MSSISDGRPAVPRGAARLGARTGLLTALLLAALSLPAAAAPFDWGFLASRDHGADETWRLRVAGPFFERRVGTEDRTFLALRPFFAAVNDPASDRRRVEWLWPLGSIKDFRGEREWRFMNAFGHDFDLEDPASRRRAAVFPLLFWGRAADGRAYAACFPLGGALREFFGREYVAFALFPLYAYSRVKDVRTHSVLWPLFSRSDGGDVERRRFFPFYGVSRNAGRWEKRFVLWPLWTSVRYEHPAAPGSGFLLFPLLGRVHTTRQDTWTVLPPFFRWGSGQGERLLHCPWPFVRYTRGDVDRVYLWPLWGRKQMPGRCAGPGAVRVESTFFLWPIGQHDRTVTPSEVRSRLMVLPLFFHACRRAAPAARQTPARDGPGRVGARYVKLWPLFSYRREGTELQCRTPALWPLRHTPAVERNWAPLWTLYSRVHSEGVRTDELLWGLFRRRRGPRRRSVNLFPLFRAARSTEDGGRREWSALLGLIRYRSEGLRRRWRLLYWIEFGQTNAHP